MNGKTPSPLRLGWTFLRVGALAFGGLGATLALIEREVVERRAWASREQITEALTYTKLLPGSTIIQVVAYLGWRLGGWRGSALATAAFILPSAVLMLLLVLGYAQIATLPALVSIRRGVLAAVVALLIVSMERLSRPLITGSVPVAVGVGAFLLVLTFNVSAVWAVLLAGFISLLTQQGRS